MDWKNANSFIFHVLEWSFARMQSSLAAVRASYNNQMRYSLRLCVFFLMLRLYADTLNEAFWKGAYKK